MKEKLAINTEILIWARASLGLNISDVATKLNKTEDEIQSWEKGTTSPTYIQLEKLAYEVYKRPIALFFFPEIPKEVKPKTDFRTLPETEVEELPTDIIKLYRKAKVFQYNLAELYDDQKPVSNSILDVESLSKNHKIERVASTIRQYLGISLKEQFSWQGEDEAFKFWRQSLEKNGIFAFKDAFKNDDFSGFCLYDELYPVIYINNSMSDTRQIFTLFHELAHLLLHAGGVDFYSSKKTDRWKGEYLKTEQWCNKFAAELLVPASDINLGDFNEKTIENYAKRFSVSREVILRKYLDAKIINQNDYNSWVNKWREGLLQKEKSQKKKSGGNYYFTLKSYLGESYIELAYRKFYKNKINENQLSDYLNIKPKNITHFENMVLYSRNTRVAK